MAKVKKSQDPKEQKRDERYEENIEKLKLLKRYTQNLPETTEVTGFEEDATLQMADDTEESVVVLDLEEDGEEVTRILGIETEVISKEDMEMVGLTEDQVRELLARGLSLYDIETISSQVIIEDGELQLEPEELKDAVIAQAIELGELEPLPEDMLSMDAESLLSTVLSPENMSLAELPGMEMMAEEAETGDLAEADMDDQESTARQLSRIAELSGIDIEELENGDLKVTKLQPMYKVTPERTEIDEKYLQQLEKEIEMEVAKERKKWGELSPEIEEQLRAKLRGKLDERLAGTELAIDDSVKDTMVLRAMTKDQRTKQETEDDKEKEEVAQSLGVDPNEIVRVIRFKSQSAGSDFLGQKLNQTNPYVMVMLRNNQFRVLKEVDENTSKKEQKLDNKSLGVRTYVEVVGREANVYGNDARVAANDKASGSGVIDLEARDLRADSATKADGEKVYVIDGENKADGVGTLVKISSTGQRTETRIEECEVETNHGNGYAFDADELEDQRFPSQVYIRGKGYDIHRGHYHEEMEGHAEAAIEKRLELLARLLEIEEQIKKEQQNDLPDLTIVAGSMIGGGSVKDGIEYSEESRQERISELESERGRILQELGYSDSSLEAARREAEKAKEAEEEYHTRGSKRYF